MSDDWIDHFRADLAARHAAVRAEQEREWTNMQAIMVLLGDDCFTDYGNNDEPTCREWADVGQDAYGNAVWDWVEV